MPAEIAQRPREHPLNLIRVMPAKGQDIVGPSIYLARLIGPTLGVAGLGMFIHPAGYTILARQMMESPALIFLAAVIGLLGGTAIVLAHNLWVADWRAIITLIGWVSIIKSASWMMFMAQAVWLWTPIVTRSEMPLIGGAITLILAAALCYFGYVASRRKGRTP